MAEPTSTSPDVTPAISRRQALQQVAAAIRLGTHVLERAPEQLENQLRARLPVETFARLHDVPAHSGPWLRLDSPSLSPVGGSLLRTLAGHTNGVNACAFSPDGGLVLSASGDRTLRLWDVTGGRELSRWVGDAPLFCCAFSPREWRVVAGDDGGAVHFLSVVGGGEMAAALHPALRAEPASSDASVAYDSQQRHPLEVERPESGRRWWPFGRRG